MARVSKGVLGKTITSLPLLALAFASWVVLLAGLAIAEHQGVIVSTCLACPGCFSLLNIFFGRSDQCFTASLLACVLLQAAADWVSRGSSGRSRALCCSSVFCT